MKTYDQIQAEQKAKAEGTASPEGLLESKMEEIRKRNAGVSKHIERRIREIELMRRGCQTVEDRDVLDFAVIELEEVRRDVAVFSHMVNSYDETKRLATELKKNADNKTHQG